MTQSLNPVVQIDFNLPAAGAARLGFDLGLILGASGVISTGERVKVYESLAEMASDGFSTTSAEYLAAQAYFAASSSPYQVAIGRIGSGETELEAITACRAANTDWYMAYCPSADNADHAAIAAYIEALTDLPTQYIFQSSDADILTNASGNVFATMATAEYERTCGIYSTNAHLAARVMGYAMGATTDAANSAYTLFAKQLVGGTVESLTTTQITNIQANYGNYYINRGGQYNMYERGTNFSGDYFDQVIYRDKLKNEMQLAVMDAIYQTEKVPQTEPGMAYLRTVIAESCDKLVTIGYIAPGVWRGPNVPGVNTGQELPTGFFVSSDAIADQSAQDKADRKAPPFYVAINEANAVHSVLITVNINV